MPALTTVRQDFAQLGAIAIDILLSDIEGSEPPAPVVLEVPELIVRASTAAPARL
ncbi:MAG TPA: substrate-binding domain-containing protein [Pseudolysinimonas sp.]